MEELIKITEKEGKRVVSARELYILLEYDLGNYSRWTKTSIEENPYAIENEDWVLLLTNEEYTGKGQRANDYAITPTFAKKLAMMAKTEVGNKIRDYFIRCEEEVKNQLATLPDFTDPVKAAEAWIVQYKEKQALALSNGQMKPKAEYFDKLIDRKLNLNFRDTAKELGVGQNTFVNWLLDNSFVYRDNKKQLKPYASHTPSLFEIKEFTNDNHSGCQTLITPRGRETFSLLIKK